MRMILTTMLLAVLVLTAGSVRADLLYEEEITQDAITRTARMTADDIVLAEEQVAGNSEFGVLTSHLSFAHRLEALPFAIPSDAILQSLSVKLYLRNHASEEIEVDVDSVTLDNFVRRNFLIGPQKDDYMTLVESPLHDGELYIVLDNPDEQFMIYRSVMKARFEGDIAMDADDREALLPGEIELRPNYPNPFNPSTTIEFALAERGRVEVDILNSLGQVVRSLADRTMSAGDHRLEWDGHDDAGIPSSSGVYFFRVRTESFAASRKMMLMK